jgi:hypothetical protein
MRLVLLRLRLLLGHEALHCESHKQWKEYIIVPVF